MSLLTVDAALAVSSRRKMPLCLIASRRQVDADAQGGGYVNHWSTETFAHYVKSRDPRGLITLARDHGGPYQHDENKTLSLPDAMASALRSFEVDILSGLQVLHLDPEKAVDRRAPDARQQFTQLTIELMKACDAFAKSRGIPGVMFEIGTDEGIGEDLSLLDWADFATDVMAAAKKAGTNLPISLAVPMGTKVKELRNIGGAVAGGTGLQAQWHDWIDGLQDIARSHNLILKLHNADYLPAEKIAEFTAAGVCCINVAPEFGVTETKALLAILRHHNLGYLAEEFLEAAYASDKWQRWLLPDSAASDEDKAIMAGHYVFALPEMMVLREIARTTLATKGLRLDQLLQSEIEKVIEHYLNAMEISNVQTKAA